MYLPLVEIILHSLSNKIFLTGIFNVYIIPQRRYSINIYGSYLVTPTTAFNLGFSKLSWKKSSDRKYF